MREIKFKIWNNHAHVMMHEEGFNILGETVLCGEVMRMPDDSSEKLDHLVDLIPLQFTGLHDKKGKEIWEGDVIRLSYPDETTELFTVVYTNYKARFQLRDMNNCGYGFDKSNRMEVIGNIYQNPELVKH